MANLRELKKEIDYRLEEVVFDCDMAENAAQVKNIRASLRQNAKKNG